MKPLKTFKKSSSLKKWGMVGLGVLLLCGLGYCMKESFGLYHSARDLNFINGTVDYTVLTPSLMLEGCDNHLTAIGSVSNDIEANKYKYEYRLNDGDWLLGTTVADHADIIDGELGPVYQNEIVFYDLESGEYTVHFKVTDDKGNSSEEVSMDFSLEYDPEIVYLNDMPVPVSTCKNGLYAVEHDVSAIDPEWNQTEYRFAGADYVDDDTPYVHNFIEFNNELWRIIGLVNVKTLSGSVEQRLKIIRTNGLETQEDFGEYSWVNGLATLEGNSLSNNWLDSSLKKLLNQPYYYSEWGECIKGYETEECDFSQEQPLRGLDDNARYFVDTDIVWNIGGIDHSDEMEDSYRISNAELYEQERGDKAALEHPAEWSIENDPEEFHGIGLMYPSDYGYASSGGRTGRDICFAAGPINWTELWEVSYEDFNNYSDCQQYDWLRYSNAGMSEEQSFTWTISAPTEVRASEYEVFGSGINLLRSSGDGIADVRPTLYLTGVSIYDGDGTIHNPYKIM